jgi:hypothetical protein
MEGLTIPRVKIGRTTTPDEPSRQGLLQRISSMTSKVNTIRR